MSDIQKDDIVDEELSPKSDVAYKKSQPGTSADERSEVRSSKRKVEFGNDHESEFTDEEHFEDRVVPSGVLSINSAKEVKKPAEDQKKQPGLYLYLLAVGALSIPGCLLRVTLVLVCDGKVGNPATASLLSNIVGCWILGFISCLSYFKKNKIASKAVGTGLCGSITTFSMYSYEENNVYLDSGVGMFIFSIFVTMMSSSGAFIIGEICGEFIDKCKPPSLWKSPVISCCLSLLGYILITGVCFPLSFCSFFDNDDLWIALLFSPPGAMLRFLLGKYLNEMDKCYNAKRNRPKYSLYFGTFLANVLGSFLYFLLHRVTMTKYVKGITTGFCGCFTTVSTFISETVKLGRINDSRWRAIVYQFVTHLFAVVLPMISELF